MSTTLVYLDSPSLAQGAEPGKADRELLAIAASHGEVVVAVPAELPEPAVTALGAYGATAVVVPDAPLEELLVAPQAAFVVAAAQDAGADLVLLPNTGEGREIAARAGIRLSAGVVTDVVAVGPGKTFTKSVLAGAYTSESRATTGIAVATVKANSVEPAAKGAGHATQRTVPVPQAGPAARIESTEEKPASGRPALEDARVVVAGGRGVEGDFAAVEQLADVLGAAVAASRAATDAGWIEHGYQVGQTGKTVSPQLYIAAGISGAVQHKAGMQTAQTIVAINSDPDAPIFEIADFGIVGDLGDVLPQAAAEIQRRRA
ncbi:electron transfer flavoprotein subunit alpha/FixB family protein [Zhihengliuella alba]|uniref:Electron transfer flavoprotein subunit alpha/FixB family protein n=1 Tax=Zhihengliuella alba TaxID=547018 RepID=A0ABP7CY62_9MICC